MTLMSRITRQLFPVLLAMGSSIIKTPTAAFAQPVVEPGGEAEITDSGWPCCEGGGLWWGDFVGRVRPVDCKLLDGNADDTAADKQQALKQLGCCEVCWCTFEDHTDSCDFNKHPQKEVEEEPNLILEGGEEEEGKTEDLLNALQVPRNDTADPGSSNAQNITIPPPIIDNLTTQQAITETKKKKTAGYIRRHQFGS